MSERNGDRARFQKNRKRKLLHRQRIRAVLSGLLTQTSAAAARRPGLTATPTDVASAEAAQAMRDDGGPIRAGD
jgi:hypothetical protein